MSPGRESTVDLHGTNSLLFGTLSSESVKRSDIDINFSTVHSSKGTEADYVLVLNFTRGRKGFPSEIEDDPILQCAMLLPESFPFAEERRLFYVALTRARRGVSIFTLEHRCSAFWSSLNKWAASPSPARTATPFPQLHAQFAEMAFARLNRASMASSLAARTTPKMQVDRGCPWTAPASLGKPSHDSVS